MPSGIPVNIVVSFSLALCLAILIIPAFLLDRSARKEINALEVKFFEMLNLAEEYSSLKARIDLIEKKQALSNVAGIAEALDEMFSALGMKGKIKSVKSLGTREMQDSLMEERAEVTLERVTMNELVNLFFDIDKAPMVLTVRKVSLKKTFEMPELLDVKMTVALFAGK
jgi:hypothetical protein